MGAALDSLVPELQPFARDLVDAASRAGYQPRVTSTVRSRAEQKRLHDRYLAGGSPFYAAPPGQSSHEYGWALDVVPAAIDTNWQLALAQLKDMGQYWREMGGAWGGPTHDPVHFELPNASAAAVARAGSGPEAHPGFLERLHALTEAHPYLSFLLGFVPYVGEAEIIAEAGYYGKKFADYLRG
jgi:hypothetical protein